MTRSRKKHPMWRDNDGAGRKKSWKQLFNRRIRRNPEVEESIIYSDGAYRKVNNSWDICDFSFYPDPNDPEDCDKAGRK